MRISHINRNPTFLTGRKMTCLKPMLSYTAILFLLLNCLHISYANDKPIITARKQLQQAAIVEAKQAIKQQAESQNWKDYKTHFDAYITSEFNQDVACPRPLHIEQARTTRKDINRFYYEITCPGKNSWTAIVTVKVEIYLPILVAKHSLNRGDSLSEKDLQLKLHNISQLRGNYLTDSSDIIGLTLKRRVRIQQPMTKSLLELPVLVSRGQQVTMIAQQNNIEVRATGEALNNGYKGELIKVKNSKSNQVVNAIVEQYGVVRMPSANP